MSIAISSAVIHQWHCDHYGHLNTRNYAALFDDAVFLFWGQAGIGAAQPGETRVVPVTAEMKTSFIAETQAGAIVNLSAQLLRIGSKSVTLCLDMHDAHEGTLLASCEVVEVFFDTGSRTSQAIPEAVKDWLQTRMEA